MGMTDVREKALVFEPILAMDVCTLECVNAQRHDWKRKNDDTKKTLGMMLEFRVNDPTAKCENNDAQPGRIKDYFNLEKHPFIRQSTGEEQQMATTKAFQIETMLGFDPSFVDDNGNAVEPRITRTGNKVAPPGGHRKFNEEFINAYFDKDEDGQETPKFGVWQDAKFTAKVSVDPGNEEFGPSNKIDKYVTVSS